jgi:polysaccharide deacetylase family protein (PEP-CTERM system associated)
MEHISKKESQSIRILTFDIEEWFHILDTGVSRSETKWDSFECRIHENTDRILEALSNHAPRIKATFFCLGWIAKKYPEIIRKIDKTGFEIGSHTNLHQLVYELGRDNFLKDLSESIKTIEDITGKKVSIFRAPGFSIGKKNLWAFECLASCGIEIDCSVFPAHHGHGGFTEYGRSVPSIISVSGITIKEFPINLFPVMGKNIVFSGGGYFRLLPYSMLSILFKNSTYIMTYFHPRDFDASQPVIKGLPLKRRFKSYFGLKSSFKKFEKLLDEFTFTDIRTASENIDWNTVPVVKL